MKEDQIHNHDKPSYLQSVLEFLLVSIFIINRIFKTCGKQNKCYSSHYINEETEAGEIK